MTTLRVFGLGVLVQFISYVNLTINFRAIAHEQYLVAVVTDALAVVISILIVQRIANPEKPVRWTMEQWGMVVGGSLAAMVGIALTRSWG